MATQNINIVIRTSGGATVVRQLNQIGQSAMGALAPLRNLERVIHLIMGALGIGKIAQWADEWTAASNKVNVFTHSQAETNKVLDELFNIAQNVRQPLGEMVSLYHRLSIGAKELGTSTQDNLDFTENIGKALAIQGTSSTQARGALLQLSQAMGEGIVRAQEYNSMIENTPLVLQIVAKNLDAAGGSTSKLRKIMLDGKLTSRDFFQAFMKGGAELEAMFAKTDKTFGQAWTVLENGLIRYIGELNKSLGISNGFFNITSLIAKNLDNIGKVLVIVATGVATAFAPTIISAFATALDAVLVALVRVAAILYTNPFAVIAMAIASVIAFGDAWNAGIDNITTVKDVLYALVGFLQDAFSAVVSEIGVWWGGLVSIVGEVYSAVTGSTQDAVSQWFDTYKSFFADVGTGFAGFLRGVARTFDAIGGLILGSVILIGRTFAGLPEVVGQVFRLMYNVITDWVERTLNVVIEGINTIRSKVGLSIMDAIKIEKLNVDKKVFEDYGQSIASSIDDGFAMQGGYIENAVNGLIDRAQKTAKERLEKENANKQIVDLTNRPTPGATQDTPDKRAQRELEKLKNSLRSLLDQIDPVNGALMQMAHAQEILEKAVKKNLITASEQEHYLDRLAEYYRDAIDPLGKYIRDLDLETQFMGLNSRQRERSIELYRAMEDLMKAGKPLSEKEIQMLKERIARNAELNESMRIQDSLLADTVEKRRDFTRQLQEMNKLVEDPNSGYTKWDRLEQLQGDFGELFENTREYTELRKHQFQEMYERIDQLRQADIISEQTATLMKLKVAPAAELALSESIANGILNGFKQGETFADMFLNLLKQEFAKTVLQPMVQPIASYGSGLINNLLSGIIGNIFPSSPAPATSSPTLMSAATGINYVPNDNQLFLLHEGEAVVPKKYNPAAGGQGGGGSITFAPQFYVDSRSDRTAVQQDMMEISQQSNEALVQKLRDAGLIG